MRRFRAAATISLAALLLISLASAALAYTVKFESNGGSEVAPYENVLHGTLIQEPPTPTRQGSDFLGWYVEPQFTTRWNFGQDDVTRDMTLYAKWSSLHRIFMENAKADVTYAHYGERIYIRADSPAWGYSFYRWISEPDVSFTNRYDDRTYFMMPNRSVVIRATYRYGWGWNNGVGGGCAGGTAANLAAVCVLALLVAVTKRR